MQLLAPTRRLAVISVVITGAAASVATSPISADARVNLTLPVAHLSEAHPVATYRLRASGTGMAKPSYATFFILGASAKAATVPLVLEVSNSFDMPGPYPYDGTTNAQVSFPCDALPCQDVIDVRLELRPQPDGTWPPPVDWSLQALFEITFEHTREVPAGATAQLELVP
jgi:hypothetical protein